MSFRFPLHRLVAACVALSPLVVPSPTAATPIVDYSLSTVGCFNCSEAGPFFSSIPTSASPGGIGFTGLTVSGITDLLGQADVDLGTIVRAPGNPSGYANFVLQVTFLLPTSMAGGQTDALIATITGNSANKTLDFDNAFQTYTFANAAGSGSFEFGVLDLATGSNGSFGIGGQIRNVSFTPTSTAAPVPEPGSLLLLGSGLVAVARFTRRKRHAR